MVFVENLLACFRYDTCLLFSSFHFLFFFGLWIRILRNKLTLSRIHVICVKRVSIPCCLHTTHRSSHLGSKDVCIVEADLEFSSSPLLENPKTLGACLGAHHIFATVIVLVTCEKLPKHHRLWTLNWANLVALAVFTYCSVNWIKWVNWLSFIL